VELEGRNRNKVSCQDPSCGFRRGLWYVEDQGQESVGRIKRNPGMEITIHHSRIGSFPPSPSVI